MLDLILGWIGFWFGHLLASRFNITIGDLGSLHLGTALLFGFIFLMIGDWLSQVNPEKRSSRRD